VRDPAVSPSGREIAYVAGTEAISDVWVIDIHGGKPIRLTDGSARCSDPSWFPDGSTVAFSVNRDGVASIWKVPRLGGPAMPLLGNAQDATISPDGGQIAFVRPEVDGFQRVWVAPLDRPESARKLTGDGVGVWDHRSPAWSPDARTLCFRDKRNLWLVEAGGGPVRALTSGDAEHNNPVWSIDGRSVYCARRQDGVESLWRIQVGNGAAVRVTRGAGNEESPTLSRDGRRLAFLSSQSTVGIVLVDMRSGTVEEIRASTVAEFPNFTPDASAVAFESNLGGSSDLWSQPLRNGAPLGDPLRLTDHSGTCAVPAFSPDGRWIAYFRVIAAQRDVWVIPARGGAPVNFTNLGGVNMEPAWSPDGRQIAFVSNRSGSEQVWVAAFKDGRRAGEARQVTSDAGACSYPTWSPDGRSIAYVLQAGPDSDVHVAAADGRAPSRRLTAGAQAQLLRWWWAKNVLLVSGTWGERLPTIRLVPPGGGEATPMTIPAGRGVDPEYAEFDLSRDGALLALGRTSKRAELWVLESEQGTF